LGKALRRSVDVFGVLAGLGVLTVIGLYGVQRYEHDQKLKIVGDSLREFERVLSIQAASKTVEVTSHGWPNTMDPAWFGGSPPQNPLAPPDRPWVEIATEDQADLADPPVRITAQRDIAGFWYNPYKGVVRARVPLLASEETTVDLYNRVNGSSIRTCVQPLVPKPAAPPPDEDGQDTTDAKKNLPSSLPRVRVSTVPPGEPAGDPK
jgi:hypothetical protein